MSHRAEKARTYRDRAQELRALAKDIHDEEQRKALLNLAREYEDMAKTPQNDNPQHRDAG